MIKTKAAVSTEQCRLTLVSIVVNIISGLAVKQSDYLTLAEPWDTFQTQGDVKKRSHTCECVSPLDCAFWISGGQVICCKKEGRDYFTPISVDPAPALNHRKPCQWGHRREREGWYLKPHPFSVNLSTPPPSPVRLVPARQSRKPCVPNRKRPSPSTTCIPNSTHTHTKEDTAHTEGATGTFLEKNTYFVRNALSPIWQRLQMHHN